jgi:DNA mismatch repair protein MutL
MLRDDAMLAFERHATSKLTDVKDLLAIATLGFRGEALPSIASVSRLMLETRSPAETTGARVEIAGGKMLRCDEAALAPGTTVTVRDLFYNVPARRKFLRSEQTELAHIASLVTHYSLAHPDKTFWLLNGTSELLNVTPVESLRERVFQVFGSRTLEDLVELGTRERTLEIGAPFVPGSSVIPEPQTEPEEPGTRHFRLRGFVSKPQVQKLNRNSIFLFVNGRLIRDRLLLHALTSAYHNLIPPNAFPFALLFLETDPEEVDVNVHPSKTEVRFRRGSFIHDFVRDSIRAALVQSRPVPTFPVHPQSAQPAAHLPYSEFTQALLDQPAPHSFSEATAPEPAKEVLPEFVLHRPAGPSPRFDFGSSAIPLESAFPDSAKLPIPDTHGAFPHEAPGEFVDSLSALGDLRPLGQLHDSFIVAAGRDGLWLIDQHVAHERVLFEQILRQQAAGRMERQQLLMPVLLELSAAQQVEYGRIADELAAIGFDSEPFGPRTLAVKAAPAGVGPGDIEKLMFEILEIAEGELRRATLADLRRGMAASIACRAAIKVNMRLDDSKIEWLLASLAATECPMSCPHGRPIALRYSMRDILRSFHRI